MDVDSWTLGTRDRSAENWSCVMTRRPMEADGLRNVTPPGGGGLLAKAPIPCLAYAHGMNAKEVGLASLRTGKRHI